MDKRDDELIPTRVTLIHRLKDWQDQASWQDFFDTYWKLIYQVSIKGGLTNAEAEDVVQQTMISVAKHIPNFKYDPAIGSFKGWMLNMTRWRMADQIRKRSPANLEPGSQVEFGDALPQSLEAGDYADPELEKLWDDEWERNLLAAAITKARRRIDPRQYQIFDCYVNKEWPPERVAKTFNISINQVYIAKSRVTDLIKEEAARLQREVI
jgi:RNA polymerase sigma-70 factor (ECF subfamily)